jgi:hypothetical protein
MAQLHGGVHLLDPVHPASIPVLDSKTGEHLEVPVTDAALDHDPPHPSFNAKVVCSSIVELNQISFLEGPLPLRDLSTVV